jgi:hypothetical protein
MNRPILVTCLCVAALAGCSRTVVREVAVERPARETVVERPVVVEKPVVRETVIERPTIASAVPPLSCSYAGIGYTAGSFSCQSGYQYRCNSSGVWDRTGSYC